MSTDREACGRCSMSTTVDVATAGEEDDADRDPYGENRIEVDERRLRTVSPGVWLSRISDRIASNVDRLTWQR